MAQLVVRNIEDEVRTRLQARAARHGRSMEEEVHDILRDAVKDDGVAAQQLGTRFARLFEGIGLTDDLPEMRGAIPDPPRFA